MMKWRPFLAMSLALLTLGMFLWLIGYGSSTPISAQAPSPPKAVKTTMEGLSPRALTTRYVSPEGEDTGDCLSSTLPCATLQYAIDQVTSIEVIHVAGGTYTDTHQRYGVTQTAFITKAIAIIGGYSLDFAEWDPAAYPTTFDAGGEGRVFVISRTGRVSLIGLNITGGDSTRQPPINNSLSGGGVLLVRATVTISGCHIYSNTAYLSGTTGTNDGGGGLAAYTSTVTLANNVFENNDASSGAGGGAGFVSSSVEAQHNIFRNNSATLGGGVSFTGGSGTLTGNDFTGNEARYGGGLFGKDGAELEIDHNTFISNTAVSDGGGLSFVDNTVSPIQLTGNVIRQNRANSSGGLGFANTDLIADNNIIADNQASFGAALSCFSSAPILRHNTIANNAGASGIYVGFASQVTATNNILVHHTSAITVRSGSEVSVDGVLWYANGHDFGGTGTIVVTHEVRGAPAFVDPLNGDYHLTFASPAIDAAADAGVASDIDGDVRPRGLAYDLGADETPAIPITAVTLYGVDRGYTNLSYVFTTSIEYPNAVPPITYTWSPEPQAGQGTATATYTWPVSGTYVITVVVQNETGIATDTHTIEIEEPVMEIAKSVEAGSRVEYGDPLTYTLVLTLSPDYPVHLTDPLNGLGFDHFVTPVSGITYANGEISGTLSITQSGAITVSFVATATAPSQPGHAIVENRACIYGVEQTPNDCVWSNSVQTEVYHWAGNLYLPLVVKNAP